MIEKLAIFFIEKSKFTLAVVISIILAWLFSYSNIEKQYNPKIEVPAFMISLWAPSLDSSEMLDYVTKPLEDKVSEIPWVDKMYSETSDWQTSLMVRFDVWEDEEKAKVNLNQKLSDNMHLKPLGVTDPVIKNIDADDLSQVTFALYYKWDLPLEDSQMYLRDEAFKLKDHLRWVSDVSTFEIVWGLKNNVVIELNNDLLESRSLSQIEVYNKIKDYSVTGFVWEAIWANWGKIDIEISSWVDESSLESYENLIIGKSSDDSYVYLKDVANIKYWTDRLVSSSYFSDDTWSYNAVFLGVWKKEGTNAIFVVEDILNSLNAYNLPDDLGISVIQNEWQTAENAISMLTSNLIVSIVIVFTVLGLSLWFRNALNSAIAIPLTLFIVFIVAFILEQNINRITLFALILILWMLVDDSTVVVENINRHMAKRSTSWKTKLEAIISAISEVKMWVVLSTVTRLFAFGSMFFVTWMMWEYMEPIPWFGFIAFIASTIIALTINPWISYYSHKDSSLKAPEKEDHKKESRWKKLYLSIVRYFVDHNIKKARKKFVVFKYSFWIALVLIMVIPISLWVFKARMLPKSDQNQVYLWLDLPWNYSFEETSKALPKIEEVIFSDDLPEDLQIAKNISYSVWDKFVSDFANLFRWWDARISENQISARINLEPLTKGRISSEEYVIKVRPYLSEKIHSTFPWTKIRLLEDPPGPPVRATFMPIIEWDLSSTEYKNFITDLKWEIFNISKTESLVDIEDSFNKENMKVLLKINKENLSKKWVNYSDVFDLINLNFNGLAVSTIKWKNDLEANSVIVTSAWESFEELDKMYLINSSWEKVYLSSVTEKVIVETNSKIYSEDKKEVSYIYAEIWNNSVIYPVISLYKILTNDSFLQDKYEVLDVSFYWIKFKVLSSWEEINLKWGWEWETTMDTFRDLWLAMIMAIVSVIFILVGQFGKFWTSFIVMITFLLWFFWIFPGYTILYLLNNEYFSATSMIWVIALAWIVVWNAILLIEYINNKLDENYENLEYAIIEACKVRFKPVLLTSITTILWAFTILWDPVWSGLAWAIIWGLSVSSILTLIVIPIFYHNYLNKIKKEMN